MKNLIILLLFTFLFFSCKKDELKGESLIFEGKWKWANSHIIYNTGTPYSSYEVVSSDSLGIPDDYYLEFDRKGKVKFYKNDKVEYKYRIVFNRFEENSLCTLTNCFSFEIYLNNDSDNTLGGRIGQDTLRVYKSNIPLEDQGANGSIINYTHRYVRVN